MLITHRATVFGQFFIYIIDFLCDCIITRGGNLIYANVDRTGRHVLEGTSSVFSFVVH
jgi:hypothetical protein